MNENAQVLHDSEYDNDMIPSLVTTLSVCN